MRISFFDKIESFSAHGSKSATFLLAVASKRPLSGETNSQLPAIELSIRNVRSFSRNSAESFPSTVHHNQPRRLQVCAQDTLRDGERKTSREIVRQTGIRLLWAPWSKRFHRVRSTPQNRRFSLRFFLLDEHREPRLIAARVFSWLTKFDVAGVSPVLNLGRAVFLGYSNRGNSLACYDAFPQCPKNANGLVYYLNNYKGGFFRLFNRFLGGSYGRYNGVAGRGGKSWFDFINANKLYALWNCYYR